VGATPHLAAELFKAMAGVEMVHVPYRSVAAGVTDVLGGRVQLMFPNPGAVMGHIKAGKLRGLGVGSLKPTPAAPGLVPISEAGLPGFEVIASSPEGLLKQMKTDTLVLGKVIRAAKIRID